MHAWTLCLWAALAAGPEVEIGLGRYQFTVTPDGTRFSYQLRVNNPSGSEGIVHLSLHGESLEAVEGAERLEPSGADIRVPSGASFVTLTGSFKGTEFKPVVKSSVSYVLLDHHPLMRLTLLATGERVSENDIGMAHEYPGAEAFVVREGERLSWTVMELHNLPSRSFAVPFYQESIFVANDGAVTSETWLAVNNAGAASMELPVVGTPTYAEKQGEALPIATNAENTVSLSLNPGFQEMVMQHHQKLEPHLGLLVGRLSLPEVSTTVTDAHVEVRYPSGWIPLYQSFGGDERIQQLDEDSVFRTGLLLWAWFVVGALGLSSGKRLALTALLGVASLASYVVTGIIYFSCCAVSIILLMVALKRRGLLPSVTNPFLVRLGVVAAVSAAVVLGVVAVGAVVSRLSDTSRSPVQAVAYDFVQATNRPATSELLSRLESGDTRRPRALQFGQASREVDASAASSAAQVERDSPTEMKPLYRGTPARVVLAAGSHRETFHEEMFTLQEHPAVSVLLVSASALDHARALLLLATGLALFLVRHRVRGRFMEWAGELGLRG
jgi:hypothetical protein